MGQGLKCIYNPGARPMQEIAVDGIEAIVLDSRKTGPLLPAFLFGCDTILSHLGGKDQYIRVFNQYLLQIKKEISLTILGAYVYSTCQINDLSYKTPFPDCHERVIPKDVEYLGVVMAAYLTTNPIDPFSHSIC